TILVSDWSSDVCSSDLCRDLGTQALRGVAESMYIYHVLGESGATSLLEVTQPRGLTPLVGRKSEVTLLLERWQQAKAGQGQVVRSEERRVGKELCDVWS